MWVFTSIGFFSAVATGSIMEDGAKEIAIRARAHEDITRLANLIGTLSGGDKPEILMLPNRDYPYRIHVADLTWMTAIADIAMEIDYTNFKSNVSKVDGYDRAQVYSKVWSVMLDLERKVGNDPKNESQYSAIRTPAKRNVSAAPFLDKILTDAEKIVGAKKAAKKNGGKSKM